MNKPIKNAQATLEALLSFLFLLFALSLILVPVARLHSAQSASIQSSYDSQSLAYDALLIGALPSFSYGGILSLPDSLYAHMVEFSPNRLLVRPKSIPAPGGFAYCIANHSREESTYGVYDGIPE